MVLRAFITCFFILCCFFGCNNSAKPLVGEKKSPSPLIAAVATALPSNLPLLESFPVPLNTPVVVPISTIQPTPSLLPMPKATPTVSQTYPIPTSGIREYPYEIFNEIVGLEKKRISFENRYSIFVNNDKYPVEEIEFKVLLPRSIKAKQNVKKISFSPMNPSYFEESGDVLSAVFILKDPKSMVVTVTADLDLFESDVRTAVKNVSYLDKAKPDELTKYQMPENFIQSGDEQIIKIANSIDNSDKIEILRSIYNYVHNTLSWEAQSKELGALNALNGRKADCTDFSDLYCAIARAKGIPARVVTGLATYINGKAWHNWVQAYTDEHGWLNIDSVQHSFDTLPAAWHVLFSNNNTEVYSYKGGYGSVEIVTTSFFSGDVTNKCPSPSPTPTPSQIPTPTPLPTQTPSPSSTSTPTLIPPPTPVESEIIDSNHATDGLTGKIVFTAFKEGSSDIYITALSSGHINRLTNNSAYEFAPRLSPDGKKVIFVSNINGNNEIYVMNSADGSNITRLTNNSFNDEYPSWSPDGRNIAFNSNIDGNNEIYVMNATDGSNIRRLTNNSVEDYCPHFSPDGKKFVFISDGSIFVMNADGSEQTKLSVNQWNHFYPAWSPDGSKIAFRATPDSYAVTQEIYVMNADGTNVIRLTDNAFGDYYPTWSPDGKKIAYVSDSNGICVMDAEEGRTIIPLLNNASCPDWVKY